MNKNTYTLIVLTCMLTLAGCKGDGNTESQSVVGNWTRLFNGSDITITLKTNGSYTVDMDGDSKAEVKGQYAIENEQITFTDQGGKNASSMGQAVYSFTVNGNQLTLTVINEPDNNRKSVAAATWTRKT